MSPKVTILMSVYNGQKYLRQAINSILCQTFTDFEFLIINDGSTERSVEIVQSYKDSRIRLVHNDQNIGLTKSLNRGLELVQGEYTARMDVDDVSLPERLEKQARYLDANPDVCVVGCWWQAIDGNDTFLSCVRVPVHRYECAFMMFEKGEQPVGHPCVMYRTAEIRALGGYNPEYRVAQDAELWFRVNAYGHNLANIPKILLLYRIHQHQTSSKVELSQKKYHDLSLSWFLSKKLNKDVSPQEAALIRPVNFNDSCFNENNTIDKMFQLKRQILNTFFKQYTVSPFQVLRCNLTLWESLFPLRKLKISSQQKVLCKNTRFCLLLLQSQLKKREVFYVPYIFFFIAGILMFLMKLIFRKIVFISQRTLRVLNLLMI